MAWLIRIDDTTVVDTDTWVLADLIEVEKESGTPWSTANPLREARVALAFIKCALRKVGRNDADANSWAMSKLKSVFDYRPDVADEEPVDEEPDPLDRSSSTAPGSSSGQAAGSTGRLKKVAAS